MKKGTIVSLLSTLAIAALIAACGGGGGGSSLQGIWYGSGENSLEDPGAYEVTFDGDGNITRLAVDGVASGLQGTTSEVFPDFFDLTLSDNSDGGILVDASRIHMAYFDENGIFAVLQKGAATLPAYVGSDVIGDWSGFSYWYSTDPDSWGEKAPFNFLTAVAAASGYNYLMYGGPSDINGVLETFDSTWGRYSGAMDLSLISGVTAFMTPDGRCFGFLSGFRGPGDGWPDSFIFFLFGK